MKREVSFVYVSDTATSNYKLLEKLYEKVSKKTNIKSEFVLASPSEDYTNLNADINFASNKNNVICVKAKDNTLYSALRAATHVTNYGVSILIKNLTEDTVENFDLESVVDDMSNYTGFAVKETELGYGMKTFYMRSMVHDVKFSDANLYNEIMYTSCKKLEVARTERRSYKHYYAKGQLLNRLYGVV